MTEYSEAEQKMKIEDLVFRIAGHCNRTRELFEEPKPFMEGLTSLVSQLEWGFEKLTYKAAIAPFRTALDDLQDDAMFDVIKPDWIQAQGPAMSWEDLRMCCEAYSMNMDGLYLEDGELCHEAGGQLIARLK